MLPRSYAPWLAVGIQPMRFGRGIGVLDPWTNFLETSLQKSQDLSAGLGMLAGLPGLSGHAGGKTVKT